jgi:hypothetical protein
LAIFRQRFTSQGLNQLFVYCAFPIHVWALVNMFRDIPSWVLYLRAWEVVGMVAYTLSYALFETLIVFLIVVLVGLVVPKRWIVDRYIPLASLWLVELAIMAIVFQHHIIRHLPKRNLVIGFGLILALSSLIPLRFPKFGKLLGWIADRLVILSFIYIIFDVIGLLVVILRNI